ncbi:MAG: hypothetical protein ACOYMA_05770 [Bacteroidia bacterium]
MKRIIKYKKTFATLKIQLCVTLLFFTFFFASCNSNSDKSTAKTTITSTENSSDTVFSNDSINAIAQSIIDISATDFYKNQKPLPIDFRNVQLRYSIKPNKEVLFILCGEFNTEENQNNIDWIHFTTIKNYDYEQWIGPSGLTYCENSTEIPYKKTDLSADLINHLNALKKTYN